MHHASPWLPEVSLVHAIEEESFAGGDSIGPAGPEEAVIDAEAGHQEQGKGLARSYVQQLNILGGGQRPQIGHGQDLGRRRGGRRRASS